MAFGKLTKQDLIDANLDPDKLAEFQAKGVTKDDLEAFKTSVTATLDSFKASFTELEAKLVTSVTNALGAKKQSNNDNQDQNNNTNNNSNIEDEQAEFMTDPVGYIKKMTGKTAAYTAVETKRVQRDIAYREASRLLKGFNNPNIKAEIDEEWKKYTPEIMARMNTDPSELVIKIHNMVMGNHIDDILADKDKKDGKFNLVHSSVGGNGNTSVGTGDTNNGTPKLTEEQKTIANKFGMTEQEYLDQIKGIDDDKKALVTKGGLAHAS
jgi:hypothetical protein